MLRESMGSNDDERTQALQRSLLELERKSDKDPDEGALPQSEPAGLLHLPMKRKSKSFSPATARASSTSPEANSHNSACFSPVEAEYLNKAMKQNLKQYDMQISLMIVGNSGTGKTQLLHSMLGLDCPGKLRPTTGYTIQANVFIGWTRTRCRGQCWDAQSSTRSSTQTARSTTSSYAKVWVQTSI